jgi:beta-phosphoglucomutase family hydrolase
MAFLFDVDGVIVDSMPVHTQAWERYLERAGIPWNEVARRMHGKHNGELVRGFFGPGLTDEEVHRHGAAKEELYRELMRDRLHQCLVPGVAEFLERHAAVPKAVGSNAEPANVAFVLDGAGLRRHFRAFVDGMQVRRPKPHPDVYLRAAALLNVEPRRCVVFEDSAVGVAAARAAGARVVGVETHQPLENVDFRISDFRCPELDSWLVGLRD